MLRGRESVAEGGHGPGRTNAQHGEQANDSNSHLREFLNQCETAAATLKPSCCQCKRSEQQKSVAKVQTEKEGSPGRLVPGYMT